MLIPDPRHCINSGHNHRISQKPLHSSICATQYTYGGVSTLKPVFPLSRRHTKHAWWGTGSGSRRPAGHGLISGRFCWLSLDSGIGGGAGVRRLP